MMYLRGSKGFSLLELLIALSILLILTGSAFLYLGDILFKSKVAKVSNDLEVIVTAVALHDAENPKDRLDTGLIGATDLTITNNLPFQNVQSLVGTYLLNTPVDPWGSFYEANSYAGYIKSYASDYKISGTSKYDKDIMQYYLPENLFLAKIRAEDLNASGILDTGDEITLYFSKSVRTTVSALYAGYTVANGGFYDNENSFGPYDGWRTGTDPDPSAGGPVFGPQDMNCFIPGQGTNDFQVHDPALRGEWVTGDVGAAAWYEECFYAPPDGTYRDDKFTERLQFLYGTTSYSRGGQGNLEIGAEVYIRMDPDSVTDMNDETTHVIADNYSRAYAIWESTAGYGAYKSLGERNRVYLQYPKDSSYAGIQNITKTLTWKDIVD